MSSKKKAIGPLDGWVAKKTREDDVDSCTTMATAAAQNMECDGNSSSSSSSTTTTTTTQRLTDVTAISTELNSTDDTASATTTVLSTHHHRLVDAPHILLGFFVVFFVLSLRRVQYP